MCTKYWQTIQLGEATQFIIYLLKEPEGKEQIYHQNISNVLIQSIIDNAQEPEVKHLCRGLTLLHLSKHTPQELIKSLRFINTLLLEVNATHNEDLLLNFND
jgi:hypothetical protein